MCSWTCSSPRSSSKLPLAVTDDQDRLVGVIPRVTLLAALGPGDAPTGELTIPVQPIAAAEIDQLLGDEPGEASTLDTEEVR